MKNILSFFRSNKRANNEHHLNVPEIRDVFKVVAKELSAYDAEFMYTGWDNMPGVCPYCHSKFKSVPDLDYLKSASNLNGNLNCSKELEHYASG